MTRASTGRELLAIGLAFAVAVALLSSSCQRPQEPTKNALKSTTPAVESKQNKTDSQDIPSKPPSKEPGRGPDDSAPWRPAGAKVTPLGPNLALGVAGDRRWVEIQATVCLTAGYLEHLLSRDEAGKQHESILSTSIDASHIHAALIAAGAKPGKPVQFLNEKGEPEFRPPSGDRIRITLHYRDKDGKIVSVPAQRWVRNVKTKKELDQDWVFAGSFFFQPEGVEKPIYAANDGRVITTANFPSALLDLPMRSEEGDPQAGLEFEANTELIPPRDTPVTVVLEVIKPDESPEKGDS
ncbi:MAG: YdjY domain-containing protein [Gemmatales bacterium]|nr:YdjY domain-containing protein [Gemmatales bacterium]MDW8386665.1 YdjY domain-containing protein [Gemmatales bacterium]